jgi:hypothetical protein
VQNGQSLTRVGVEHHHIALNRGTALRRVVGDKGDQLGHRHAAVGSGHHKQTAATVQPLHDARRYLHRIIGQQILHTSRQLHIGQGECGLAGA